MYTVNDSAFALLLRFVGCGRELSVDDQEFIQEQVKVIKEHVEGFPPEEQDKRALEWIQGNSEKYRARWERQALTKELVDRDLLDQRCADCPLAGDQSHRHCEIHDEWKDLLRRYVNDELAPKEYVEKTLKLISEHKERLKIKLSLVQPAETTKP